MYIRKILIVRVKKQIIVVKKTVKPATDCVSQLSFGFCVDEKCLFYAIFTRKIKNKFVIHWLNRFSNSLPL